MEPPELSKILRSVVTGVGGYLPERIVTNEELSTRVDTSDEWIRERTGIRQRRQAADDQPVSDLAVEAAKKALAAAGRTPADVDLINDVVFSVVVPDFFATLIEPAWSVRLWRRLKLAVASAARSRAPRQVVRVPTRIRHAAGTIVGTVRDLSATGLAVQSAIPLPLGSPVVVSMVAPDRALQGHATVARCEARTSREGFTTWILGLQFTSEQPEGDVDAFRRWDAA